MRFPALATMRAWMEPWTPLRVPLIMNLRRDPVMALAEFLPQKYERAQQHGPDGCVTFVNRSAQRLLDWSGDEQSLALAVAVPEFVPLFDQLLQGPAYAAPIESYAGRDRSGRERRPV